MAQSFAHFLLVHGWGMDSAFWHPLISLFPPTWTYTILDPYEGWGVGLADGRLSCGEACQHASAPAVLRILLAHSAGLVYAMQKMPRDAWDVWIACNSFSAFLGMPAVAACVPRAELRALRYGVGHNPETTVQRFRARLDVDEPMHPLPPVSALRGWLDALMEWRVDADPLLAARRGLVLAGERDPLVPSSQTAALACQTGAPVALCPEGGHSLPLTHPKWCRMELERWIHGHA